MTRRNHRLCAIAVALSLPIVTPTTGGIVTGLAIIATSSLPDGLERRLGAPHRTILHAPIVWIAALAIAIFAVYAAHAMPAGHVQLGRMTLALINGYELVARFGLGIAISGLLHIVLDVGSPMGLPARHPYDEHRRLRVQIAGQPIYVTATYSELRIVLPLIATAAAVQLLAPYSLVHAIAPLPSLSLTIISVGTLIAAIGASLHLSPSRSPTMNDPGYAFTCAACGSASISRKPTWAGFRCANCYRNQAMMSRN